MVGLALQSVEFVPAASPGVVACGEVREAGGSINRYVWCQGVQRSLESHASMRDDTVLQDFDSRARFFNSPTRYAQQINAVSSGLAWLSKCLLPRRGHQEAS